MANHNANYIAMNLAVGAYGPAEIGNGISATTIHQVFCITDGSITISALGGGTFTWSATAGQKVDVLTSKLTVVSGAFVGFKTKLYNLRSPMQGS